MYNAGKGVSGNGPPSSGISHLRLFQHLASHRVDRLLSQQPLQAACQRESFLFSFRIHVPIARGAPDHEAGVDLQDGAAIRTELGLGHVRASILYSMRFLSITLI